LEDTSTLPDLTQCQMIPFPTEVSRHRPTALAVKLLYSPPDNPTGPLPAFQALKIRHLNLQVHSIAQACQPYVPSVGSSDDANISKFKSGS
jgi:hypothetical protein